MKTDSLGQVFESDTPETTYGNVRFANAMDSLNMIDIIGIGIRRMFIIQKNKYFLIPDNTQKLKSTSTNHW